MATLTLSAALALLLAGPPALAPVDPGPCTRRTSQVISDVALTLRIDAEPARGQSRLLHLCADPTDDAVTVWAAAVTGPSGEETPVPVQAVGDRIAIAAVPVTARPTVLTVRTTMASGALATFTTALGLPPQSPTS